MELIKRGYNVLMIDEYRTSKLCNQCHLQTRDVERSNEWLNNQINIRKRKRKRISKNLSMTNEEEERLLTKMRRSWGVKRCTNCKKVWCRDVNACMNMHHIFRCHLSGLDIGCYKRGTECPPLCPPQCEDK
jgi:transposase